jgi:hypothetical protein
MHPTVEAARAWMRRPHAPLLVLGVAVALVAIFNLAWYVPGPSEPVYSVSYSVRYNNLVAVAGLLAGCALAFAAGVMKRCGGAAPDEAEEDEAGGSRDAAGVPWRDVAMLGALTVVVYGAFMVVTRGYPILESNFFFDTIGQALTGGVPNRDFDYPYGQLMLYAPAALVWLAARVGLPPATGYYAALGLALIGGVPLLAWVIGRLGFTRARARAVFWILGLYGAVLCMSGLNYAPVRFLSPIACILVLSRLADRAKSPAHSAVTGAAAIAMAALNAGISPELGVAFAAAAPVLLGSGGGLADRTRRPALAVLAVGVGVGAVALGGSVLPVIASFAKGAFSMPVLPSPYNLVFVSLALFASFASGVAGGRGAGRPAMTALLVLGLGLVPAAFGRADIPHVYWNGIPILLLSAALVPRAAGRWFKAWATVVAATFTAWSLVLLAVVVAPNLLLGATATGVASRDTALALSWVRGLSREQAAREYDSVESRRRDVASTPRLLRLDKVAMPLGDTGALGLEYGIQGKLVPTHGDANGPVDDRQLAALLQDLEKAEYLVIPAVRYNSLEAAARSVGQPTGELGVISGKAWNALLQFPVRLQTRRVPYTALPELGVAVFDRFERAEAVDAYVVMKRKR